MNNVMRHKYKDLSEAEKIQIKYLKDEGLRFWEAIHSLDAFGSRELSLAKTKVEEAVFWATKHLSR